MTISLGFYLDANLSTPITTPLNFEQATDGSTGPQVRAIYIGSAVSNHKFEADINSGVSPILLSIADNQPGVGQESSNVKLALEPDDLVNAVAGEPLSLPATILSGVINAIPVYIQVEDSNGIVGTDTSLSLVTNNIVETENTL